jgi:hypothetical protein
MSSAPPITIFTPAERRLIRRKSSPTEVQHFLNQLPYNTEPPPVRGTLRSFRQVLRHGTAHCLEAALSAACILEQHGYPPLLLDIHSIDNLDHVVFVYKQRGRWGSVGRSRDPGLHGRKPVFRSIRALAMSYVDPFVDFTGGVKGYALFDLRKLGTYDWRLSPRNLWALERTLIRNPGRPIKVAGKRIRRLRARYRKHMAEHKRKPIYYRGREKWTDIPDEYLRDI